ncbi:MAG: ATPase domain-containing protein [Candidatus Binataceae bacterium]
MAAGFNLLQTAFADKYASIPGFRHLLAFSGEFRGRELTPKQRRLNSGLLPLDRLLNGGIVHGRISEIIGVPGTGKTSLAAAFMAHATARGETCAWIDSSGSFDPASIAAAGVALARVLWVATPDKKTDISNNFRNAATHHNYLNDYINCPGEWRAALKRPYRSPSAALVKAAEWLLVAGGFGLIVLDFKEVPALPQAVALRLARAAERSGTAVLVIAARRMCGTFAALSLMVRCNRAGFSRSHPKAPILFDGLELEAHVARNKLGGSGGTITWKALAHLEGANDLAFDNVVATAGVRGHGRHDGRALMQTAP